MRRRLRDRLSPEGPLGCLLVPIVLAAGSFAFFAAIAVLPMWLGEEDRIVHDFDGTVGCTGGLAEVWEPHLDFAEADEICDEAADDAEASRTRLTIVLGVSAVVVYGALSLLARGS